MKFRNVRKIRELCGREADSSHGILETTRAYLVVVDFPKGGSVEYLALFGKFSSEDPITGSNEPPVWWLSDLLELEISGKDSTFELTKVEEELELRQELEDHIVREVIPNDVDDDPIIV